MAIFRELVSSDIKTSKSSLVQLVDILQQDISGSDTRRKSPIWVTGGIDPGVTSSIFQTVYDQSFTLQTANPIFDMTIGINSSSVLVASSSTGVDLSGKYLFPSTTIQMREKMSVYQQFSQQLLGDASEIFQASTTTNTIDIKEALFLSFKRLFSRDGIKRETFAMKFYPTGSTLHTYPGSLWNSGSYGSGSTKIYTDVGSSTNKLIEHGGAYAPLVAANDTTTPIGMLFYDQGIAVLDMRSVVDFKSSMNGVIDGLRSGTIAVTGSVWTDTGSGKFLGLIPSGQVYFEVTKSVSANESVTLYPFSQFLVSASIDDVVDHIALTRFGGTNESTQTAMAFQNITSINSTLIFCRIGADEFNYSSNPTYTDSNNRIVVIDQGQEDIEKSFTYITSVGFYDANDNLLAVGKTSRPLYKDSQRDLTIRCRLDWKKTKYRLYNIKKVVE